MHNRQPRGVLDRPLRRILHVLGQLEHGGCEAWLQGVLRHLDPARFQTDILIHSTRAPLAGTFRALGARVFVCRGHHNPWLYRSRFLRHVRTEGPYAAVHSHVYHFSGFVLKLARAAGVPIRIAHAHNDFTLDDARRSVARRAYTGLMHRWIQEHATIGLGASRNAMTALFDGEWTGRADRRVLRCGIDLSPFQRPVDSATVRHELNLPHNAFVVGHVGRVVPVKNQQFLLHVIREVALRRPDARLLLIGEGPLRQQLEQQARQLGVANRVTFAGPRDDVPRTLAAVDVFALPSLAEALPLALLEAQAAGVPCVVADGIAREADALPGLVHRVSLDDVSAWADDIIASPGRALRGAAVARLIGGEFDIRETVRALESIYAMDA